VAVEYDKRSGRPRTTKTTWNVEKIREVIHEEHHRKIYELTDTVGFCYGVAGDLNRKFEHAPHCRKVCSPTLNKWSKAVTCKRVSWAMREG
jgi:hypothetical protein